MDSIKPFVFLQRYRVTVCEECGWAVVAEEILTHLQKRHRATPVKQWQQLAVAIASHSGIIRNQNDLVEFQYPPPTINYIPQLAPPQTDGLKCRKCPYIARQLQTIQQHCRVYHGWKNEHGVGRPSLKRKRQAASTQEESPPLPWRESVACQRFFRSRNASGWFEVERKSLPVWASKMYAPEVCEPSPEPPSAPRPKRRAAIKAVKQHVEAVLQRHEQYIQAQNQPRVYAMGLGEDSLEATSPWLERTQWRTMYRNVRRDILKAMTTNATCRGAGRPWSALLLGQGEREGDADLVSPACHEQKIACILGAVDLMVNRCETTACHTSRLTRCWLVTSRVNSYESRAFSVMTELSTRRRYRLVWKRFIVFVIRACFLPEAARKQVRVAIPPEVRDQIRRLWEHRVWGQMDTSKGQWPTTADERYQAGVGRQSAAQPDLPSSALEAGNVSEDGFDEDASESDESDWASDAADEEPYKEPDDESLECERGTHVMTETASSDDSVRVEFLELLFQFSMTLSKQEFLDGDAGSTLLVYFSGVLGFTSDYQHFMLARQFCPSLSGLIYMQRLLFLEYALPRFGYKISKTEVPPCLLQWSDDDQTVRCGLDLLLSMDMFRRLPDYFLSQAENLCADLMYAAAQPSNQTNQI